MRTAEACTFFFSSLFSGNYCFSISGEEIINFNALTWCLEVRTQLRGAGSEGMSDILCDTLHSGNVCHSFFASGLTSCRPDRKMSFYSALNDTFCSLRSAKGSV